MSNAAKAAEGHEKGEKGEAPPEVSLQRSDVAVAADAAKAVSRGRAMNSKWRSLWAELGGVT